MLTDDQITVLAREYAEEENPIESYSDTMFERALDLSISRGEALRVLTWLTRRYCVVEKSKVEEEYHEVKFTCGNVDPCSDIFVSSIAQKSLLDRLFPELAKASIGMSKKKKKGLYRSNKEAKVGETIECPVCHNKFIKRQYSQAFCCGHCKDRFHNMRCKDRRKYNDSGDDNPYDSFSDEAMDLGIADYNTD